MLVISRKLTESIIINNNIEIFVSEISGDKVKICINAPREIPVVRKELLETKNLNREASVAPQSKSLNDLKSRLNQ